MTELADLPPGVRARLYREFAADARREAASATGAPKESYLLIAEQWEKLAEEQDRRSGQQGLTPSCGPPKVTAIGAPSPPVS